MQALEKENEQLNATIKEMDVPLLLQLKARMKAYHVIPLEEHQEALREEAKVQEEIQEAAKNTETILRTEVEGLSTKLTDQINSNNVLTTTVGELESKLTNIQSLLGNAANM